MRLERRVRRPPRRESELLLRLVIAKSSAAFSSRITNIASNICASLSGVWPFLCSDSRSPIYLGSSSNILRWVTQKLLLARISRFCGVSGGYDIIIYIKKIIRVIGDQT